MKTGKMRSWRRRNKFIKSLVKNKRKIHPAINSLKKLIGKAGK